MAKRTSHTIGLDIGTSRVTCIVGEAGEAGRVDIVGIGEAEGDVLFAHMGALHGCVAHVNERICEPPRLPMETRPAGDTLVR